MSRAEDSVAGDGLLYWRRADNSAWFIFGSFLGETMGGEADGRFTAARCARVHDCVLNHVSLVLCTLFCIMFL